MFWQDLKIKIWSLVIPEPLVVASAEHTGFPCHVFSARKVPAVSLLLVNHPAVDEWV